jgi:hypothetical protein
MQFNPRGMQSLEAAKRHNEGQDIKRREETHKREAYLTPCQERQQEEEATLQGMIMQGLKSKSSRVKQALRRMLMCSSL